MGKDSSVDTVTRPRVQTTVLLTLEQAERIEALQREWGDPSMASVVRRLLTEALEARALTAEAKAS